MLSYSLFRIGCCCDCLGRKALRNEHSSRTSLESSQSKASQRTKSSFRFAQLLRRIFSRKHRNQPDSDDMGARLGRTDKITSSEPSIASSQHKTLTENEIQLLLSNTTMSREQIIDFHRNFLQDCPNGCLTKKEFLKMFKQIHPVDKSKQKADKFSDYVFRYLTELPSFVFSNASLPLLLVIPEPWTWTPTT